MPQKIIIVADPGIDTAFAIALALLDPKLDVLALAATAGNVPAQQATINVHTIITQLDPSRYPRIGAAPLVTYPVDGTRLHGADGLGNVGFPDISLHAPHSSDRLIVELVRKEPKEITVVCLGPLTVMAGVLGRDPNIVPHIDRLICLGGSWREPGNASAAAEFHFYCDPVSARKVLHCGAHITLLPLDVTRKLIFSPTDLLELPAPESKTSQFLRKIIPFGIRASSNLYGTEGFHLKDVLGIAALVLPKAITTQRYYVDVETQGELTRGTSVVDARANPAAPPNVDLATGVDVTAVRDYIVQTLQRGDTGESAI
ncbi:MAG: nucleoside hydrolase [Gemmataceae bacterium]